MSDYLQRWDTGYRSPLHDRVRRHYRVLRASQHWSRTEWDAYLLRRLRQLVRHAWDHVPLYQELWGEQPEIRTIEDFRNLPILEREIVSANLDAVRATSLPSGTQVGPPATTSGSSGQVVRIFPDSSSVAAMAAAEILEMEWEGVEPTAPTAYVRTYSSGPPETVQALSQGVRIPRWAVGPLREMFPWGDAFLIDASASPSWIAQFLDAAKPQRLVGYPTVLLMACERWKPDYALQSVRCYGENLHPTDVRRLEELVHAKVWNAWSAAETGPIAHACPEAPHTMHVHAYLHLFEIVRPDGTPCEFGESGSVLVTPLYALATPLLRYRLGDSATFGECVCGRSVPTIVSMDGREFSRLRTRGGESILSSRLIDRFGKLSGLRRFQILQRDLDQFEILLVTDDASFQGLSNQVETLLREFLAAEGEIEVVCRRVEELPLSPSGKFEKVRWIGPSEPK